jgi:pimeloyl-ACP methyl ester carboxylesterase
MPYTPLMMADVAAAVLDHFDVTAADVVGLSWGGLLAQQLALQHGARVNRLVLAATAAGMVMVPPDLSQWTQGAGPDGIDRGILQRWITTAADWQQGVWDQMKRQHPRIGPGMMHQSLAFAGWSSAPWLPLFLTMPTLILANRHDPIVPMPNADLLHALIPGSRLETVDSGGHFFLLSEIDTVRARIIAFLDG